ncbi:hypothetical protein C7974DRAFT_155448 [Boeremia exigua]|uniref:uncharacterized protein n=1 Tax=Boeremia exigua TaxID=749465 RepID=UPI001E8DF5D2|nr:uncharacterized protein C7974DRAFT_155448 [Boeremia exigua]KAH6638160.1 hypothetical protein C7974DRAFT_155448 [Boeremia exigua]
MTASIKILEATVAQRTSTGVRPTISAAQSCRSKVQGLNIVRESHTVIGLRLSGMNEMGYVWAKVETPLRTAEGRIWGNVRLAGLRNDIPAPFLGLAADCPAAEGKLKVVEKGSIIELPSTTLGGRDNSGRVWI